MLPPVFEKLTFLAAVNEEPPEEVAAAGHDRLIVIDTKKCRSLIHALRPV
jgi:hypothetical protein